MKPIKYYIVIFSLIISFILNYNVFGICIPKTNENINQSEFLGNWKMQTIVTNSNCPYVLIGSTTESSLKIKPFGPVKEKNNVFKGLWSGGNWSDSKSIIKLLNNKEAIAERDTEMKTDDNNNWKAALIDHFYLDENNLIRLESIVTQFKNGISVGEYKTISILTKSN